MDWLLNDLGYLLGIIAEEAQHLVSIDWYRQNFVALVNIIMIDLVLAGDNAIVVGLAASRVAARDPRQGHLLGHRRARSSCASSSPPSPHSCSPSSA